MRKPNPWIVVPAVGTGLVGGALGWMVTDISCRDGGAACPVWAALFALVTFLAVGIGVALLLVLVFRSLAEWRDELGRR